MFLFFWRFLGKNVVNPFSAENRVRLQWLHRHTGKIIKYRLRVFERRENLLQNDILDFVSRLNQSSEIVLGS